MGCNQITTTLRFSILNLFSITVALFEMQYKNHNRYNNTKATTQTPVVEICIAKFIPQD